MYVYVWVMHIYMHSTESYLLDQPIFHVYVSIKGLVIIHNLATFDQKAITL